MLLPHLLAPLLAALAWPVTTQDTEPPETVPAEIVTQETVTPQEGLTPEDERLVEEATQAEASQIRTETAALGERLNSILGAVEEFHGIRADVDAGVVVLRGTAPSRAAVERAVSMAEKLEGALWVGQEVDVERAVDRRLGDAWDQIGVQLRQQVLSIPLYLTAAGILVAFWLLARLLRDARFLFRFVSSRELLQNLLRQSVHLAVLLVGCVVALRFLDAGALIGTILGAAGVAGIALGFAFRSVIESYLAGILLAIRQPFRARDLVDIDGSVGTVLRMTASETILLDADGNHLRLPNSTVFNGKVLNYTRNPLRRFQVEVGVGTEVRLDEALDVGLDTLGRMKGVLADPAPSGSIEKLGDSTVSMVLYGWVDQREASWVKVSSEARRLVKERFDEAGISMPAPIYQVVLERGGRGKEDGPAGGESPAAAAPAPEAIDVTPGDDIARQVDEEIARSDEPDLLAPK